MMAYTIAEVGSFVHVLPKSIEFDCLMESVKLGAPPCVSLRVEEVGVSCLIGPYLSNEYASIDLHEDVLLHALVEGLIALVRSVSNTGINDWHEFHVVGMKLVYEFRKSSEGSWVSLTVLSIIGEVLIVLHVVDINPLSIKRNLVVDVTLSRCLNICEILIAPFALIPSECPLRSKYGCANQTVIL